MKYLVYVSLKNTLIYNEEVIQKCVNSKNESKWIGYASISK